MTKELKKFSYLMFSAMFENFELRFEFSNINKRLKLVIFFTEFTKNVRKFHYWMFSEMFENFELSSEFSNINKMLKFVLYFMKITINSII